jgi:predicted MFS family arabinose efflux permease
MFGELGARYSRRYLLAGALLAYSVLSLGASFADSINALVIIRFFQGLASAAPAVFAPGLVRAMFSERGALRAIGFMGSVESLTPAFAPIIGAWLLNAFDWRASFFLSFALALLFSLAWLIWGHSIQLTQKPDYRGNFKALFHNRAFLVQALSHACTLGALLIFVFGAPTVITRSMNGSLSDFVIMQIIGISLFIIASNTTHKLVEWFGSDNVVFAGSAMSALGCVLILLYSLSGCEDPRILWLLFAPVNMGLGLRGPPGFYRAVVAAGDDDARGSALIILFILTIAAGGTALVAPFIHLGLTPLAGAAALTSIISVVLLKLLHDEKAHHT